MSKNTYIKLKTAGQLIEWLSAFEADDLLEVIFEFSNDDNADKEPLSEAVEDYTTGSSYRLCLSQFCSHLDHELMKNSWKQHWSGIPMLDLAAKIIPHAYSLQHEMYLLNKEAIARKCIHIANYAMMIWEKATEQDLVDLSLVPVKEKPND